MTTNIYPSLEDSPERVALYKQRSDKIIYEIKQLQDKSKHYVKLAKRWTTASSTIEHVSDISVGIAFVSISVLLSLITAGIAIPAVIPLVIAGAPIIELGTLKGVKLSLIKKKRNKYAKKASLIKDYINRLWIYHEKAKQDGIISVDELEGFIKLINELDSKLETGFSEYESSGLNLATLRKQAEAEVKNELNQEYIEKIKQEMRAK
jgi:hypothetical protein